MQSVQYIVLHSRQCTLCIAQCTVHSALCTLSGVGVVSDREKRYQLDMAAALASFAHSLKMIVITSWWYDISILMISISSNIKLLLWGFVGETEGFHQKQGYVLRYGRRMQLQWRWWYLTTRIMMMMMMMMMMKIQIFPGTLPPSTLVWVIMNLPLHPRYQHTHHDDDDYHHQHHPSPSPRHHHHHIFWHLGFCLDRPQSLFQFVPQESHSQAGLAN